MKNIKNLNEVESTYNFYKDDFEAGQQFFDFMWEDPVFKAAYQLFLDKKGLN